MLEHVAAPEAVALEGDLATAVRRLAVSALIADAAQKLRRNPWSLAFEIVWRARCGEWFSDA